MNASAGVGLFQLAARLLCILLLASEASGAFAQGEKEKPSKDGEEQFKDVDPYTKGDAQVVQQAGYKSLAPFSLADGILSQDVVELLGGVELLWAETEHLKICSSLQ